jgi:cytochrome c biogenesis protein CcdA/thiol-disulfide isomerase/thioredoxin
MLLLALAYLGGILTILSPCILPVLPFVFARSDRPFLKSGLPLLAGMAATFALVASLATVGGNWAVRANQVGRIAALVLFGIFGLTLLFSSLAERLSRPLVRLGGRLSSEGDRNPGAASSFVLGIATGLLWTPCAGPILGLILTGAAVSGANAHTTILLLVYAAGAATSLALAVLAGGRVFAAMKRSLGAEEWIRRILGVAVLAGVAMVALGLDRGVLTRLSLASTSALEDRFVARVNPQDQPNQQAQTDSNRMMMAKTEPNQAMMAKTDPNAMMAKTDSGSGGANAMMMSAGGGANTIPASLPGFTGASAWINSPPLTPESLRGKVVVVDFWTYSCINCLRSLPYIESWYEKYKDSGLVVIGVHTPEFPFEKDESNVRKAVSDFKIQYPVAMDNDYQIWNRFNNRFWPAHYFIDATGRVRYHYFGEGHYDESEGWIRSLLEERNRQPVPSSSLAIAASGVQAAPDLDVVKSPETYIGYERARHFASPGGVSEDDPEVYKAPASLDLNDWALTGKWSDGPQTATLLSANGGIVYRFHARDLHLVLGPAADGKPIRFRVTLDGKAPGADHGLDTDSNGYGVVTGSRLYQLIRQQGDIHDRAFRIEFLSPGVQAFAFTFG